MRARAALVVFTRLLLPDDREIANVIDLTLKSTNASLNGLFF